MAVTHAGFIICSVFFGLKMMLKGFLFALSFSSLASAAAVKGCNADYCLRALRASQISTRLSQASADCFAFLQPTTVTHTQTLTFSSTSTITSSTSLTDTVHGTRVTTLSSTTTVTITGDPVTTSLTAPILGSTVFKRTLSATPSIPAYASPCSGAVRFSSACGCIGVPVPTNPSTTVTVSTTLSFTTTATKEVWTAVTEWETKTSTEVTTVTDTITPTVTISPALFKVKATFEDGSVKYLSTTDFSAHWSRLLPGLENGTVFWLSGTNLTTTDGYVIAAEFGGVQLLKGVGPGQSYPDFMQPMIWTRDASNRLFYDAGSSVYSGLESDPNWLFVKVSSLRMPEVITYYVARYDAVLV